MNNTLAVVFGVSAFTAGCAVVGIAAADHCRKVDDKLTGISRGMKYLQDNVDLNIDPEVAEKLVSAAARDVAYDISNKAAESAKKEIQKEISNKVKESVKASYKELEGTLTEKLESQINIQTIEKIQDKVAEKVAKQVLNGYVAPFGGTSKADVAKACIDGGMDGFDVARVMSSLK